MLPRVDNGIVGVTADDCNVRAGCVESGAVFVDRQNVFRQSGGIDALSADNIDRAGSAVDKSDGAVADIDDNVVARNRRRVGRIIGDCNEVVTAEIDENIIAVVGGKELSPSKVSSPLPALIVM